MSLRVTFSGKVKPEGVAEAKASLNRAIQSLCVDPKPSDLSMTRLKRASTWSWIDRSVSGLRTATESPYSDSLSLRLHLPA